MVLSLGRIRVVTLILGAVVCLVLLAFDPQAAISAGVGVILGWLNLMLLASLVRRLLMLGQHQGRKIFLALMFVGKYVLVLGLIAILVIKLAVQPIALALGFSAVVVALLGVSLRGVIFTTKQSYRL